MPRKRDVQEMPGYDSFLDIVANLVGILIILITVIGVQAKDALLETEPQEPPPELPKVDLESARKTERALDKAISQSQEKIRRQASKIRFRELERQRLLALNLAAEKALQKKQSELAQDQQRQLARARELQIAKEELARTRQIRRSLELAPNPQQTLEHRPTPLAKTVFGKELHFQLDGQRLTFVPWDAALKKMEKDIPAKISKLKSADRITETLSPIGGFQVKYTFRRGKLRPEFENFELWPVSPNLGETLDVALRPNSMFASVLHEYNPDNTTLTVWVYPNSFAAFRRLKAEMYNRGYLVAGRPMPAGEPIGGSPDGSRSSAQ